MDTVELKALIIQALTEWNHRPTYVLTNMVNSSLSKKGDEYRVKTPRILSCMKSLEKEGRVAQSPKKYNPYARQKVWCIPAK